MNSVIHWIIELTVWLIKQFTPKQFLLLGFFVLFDFLLGDVINAKRQQITHTYVYI